MINLQDAFSVRLIQLLCFKSGRHCASGNQPKENLFGVAIRCGQDRPDEYGKTDGQDRPDEYGKTDGQDVKRGDITNAPIFWTTDLDSVPLLKYNG